MSVAREVVVHGLVQGVFYRVSCREEAARRGVSGWVRNERDGTVRALFEGPADAVDAMIAWCLRGPDSAVVEHVDVLEREPSDVRGFSTG